MVYEFMKRSEISVTVDGFGRVVITDISDEGMRLGLESVMTDGRDDMVGMISFGCAGAHFLASAISSEMAHQADID